MSPCEFVTGAKFEITLVEVGAFKDGGGEGSRTPVRNDIHWMSTRLFRL